MVLWWFPSRGDQTEGSGFNLGLKVQLWLREARIEFWGGSKTKAWRWESTVYASEAPTVCPLTCIGPQDTTVIVFAFLELTSK